MSFPSPTGPGMPPASGMPPRSGMPPGPSGVPAPPNAAGGLIGGPARGSTGLPGTSTGLPGTEGPTVTIACYDNYVDAQATVDYLSDNQFPVERTAIIGTDLRLVEYVLGRMTTTRAALAGAGGGAWLGLLIGLLFGIFSVASWWRVLVAAIIIGTVWGAVFGAIAHAMTGGRRDFSSRSSLQATQYAVTVDADVADQARQLLTRHTWQTSGAA